MCHGEPLIPSCGTEDRWFQGHGVCACALWHVCCGLERSAASSLPSVLGTAILPGFEELSCPPLALWSMHLSLGCRAWQGPLPNFVQTGQSCLHLRRELALPGGAVPGTPSCWEVPFSGLYRGLLMTVGLPLQRWHRTCHPHPCCRWRDVPWL